MNYTKTIVTCKVCKKELLNTSFNKHLKTHGDPLSRNCNKWYKKYFHSEEKICVCNICDEEIHVDYPSQYEEHLNKHNIDNGFKL